MITTQVAKWGNSVGVRLPKSILKEANISVNDEVSISYVNNTIVIEKAQPELTIKELFANYEGGFPTEEVDFGEAERKEIW